MRSPPGLKHSRDGVSGDAGGNMKGLSRLNLKHFDVRVYPDVKLGLSQQVESGVPHGVR